MDSVQKIINIIAEYDCESFINIVILTLKKNGYDKIIAVSKAKLDNIEGLLKYICSPKSKLTLEDAISVKQCVIAICEACTKDEVTHFVNKMDSQVQY